ncbi:UMF1 family MFS transporter [Trueperella bonasi]|uniref:UMF1 family MFS transporter n=1 Tax=Trueperella bonasi TaxID=312286 RepID=A0ABT9NFP3_9ACTO|nr:MFS transporter [Trueperella bonasi]MDP9806214.1 UMF1 family MFS transporter [Trueperella bonasi]
MSATETHTDNSPRAVEPKAKVFTGKVWAWGLWDWGSAAFNAIVTTFVFSVYLTNADLFGPDANRLLGYVLAAAGIFVAVIAPVLGQSVDRTGKSATVMRVTTLLTALITACLYFVSPGEAQLWLGLFLLAAGNVAFETGSVVYNAIITDISSPENVGRVSGFGWGLGYIGGIVLLLILFVGFIEPDVGWFGVTSENGLNVRVAMLVAALWTVVFSAPLLIGMSNKAPRGDTPKLGVVGSYKLLFASMRRLWNTDRGVVWFLLSSAIYRDGLAGAFAFGAVLAAAAFGFEAGEVIIFGIAANLVAGIATIVFGWLDDILGARTVIIISLVSMVTCGLMIFFFHDGLAGLSPKIVYWIFGLLLCVFVGPTQSASRTYLARIAPPGEEGEIFGLYATTGRAVSFLSPFMYSTAITIGAAVAGIAVDEAAYFGILGIAIVLLAGLVAFLPVKAQPKADDAES